MFLIALCCWPDFSFKCTSRCDFLLFNLQVYRVHIERETYWWFVHSLWSRNIPPEKRLLQNNLPLSITPFLYTLQCVGWACTFVYDVDKTWSSLFYIYTHNATLCIILNGYIWTNYSKTMPFRICIHYSELWWLLWSLQHCFIIIIVPAHIFKE